MTTTNKLQSKWEKLASQNVTTGACFKCGSADHWARECTQNADTPYSRKGKGNGKGKGPEDGGECFRCGESGHWARECPNHSGKPRFGKGSGIHFGKGKGKAGKGCFRCGGPHLARDCPNAESDGSPRRRGPQDGGECFKCGKTGHWARECPNVEDSPKQGACHRCGEEGHWTRECPLIQKLKIENFRFIISKIRSNFD